VQSCCHGGRRSIAGASSVVSGASGERRELVGVLLASAQCAVLLRTDAFGRHFTGAAAPAVRRRRRV
jgi:hypothetical protein